MCLREGGGGGVKEGRLIGGGGISVRFTICFHSKLRLLSKEAHSKCVFTRGGGGGG